jgi:hypothetical protein
VFRVAHFRLEPAKTVIKAEKLGIAAVVWRAWGSAFWLQQAKTVIKSEKLQSLKKG